MPRLSWVTYKGVAAAVLPLRTITGGSLMYLDRRDCPDWMHIRQWLYLEKTSPRVLLTVLPGAKYSRERHRNERRPETRVPINRAGMIRQRFPQKFPQGNKCCLCGVHTVRGESVAYWGSTPSFGHALCRVAEWTARHDALETKKSRDAEYARRRRR